MVSEYETEIIRFTGGEPLINSNTFDLIHIAKDSGVQKVGLTTNGILIPQYAAQLIVSGIDDCVVHIYQIDSFKPANMTKIKDFVKVITTQLNQVRFNIVLTQQNLPYTIEFVHYAIANNISVLILDMLQAGITDSDFERNYCSLDKIREIIFNYKLVEKVENMNSRIYTNSNSYIKLVEHYSDYKSRCSYCSRDLEYNPFLLTPNFNISVCTHFGKHTFSIRNAVINRDKDELHRIICSAKQYLSSCNECSKNIILSNKLDDKITFSNDIMEEYKT
jgi:molybdenum cofactor biosynthesis enzyme MoaA